MADPSISRWGAYWELYYPGVVEGPNSWKEQFGVTVFVLHYLWIHYAVPAGIKEADFLMLLFFMKCYPIAAVAATRFLVHPSTFMRNVLNAAACLSPILNEVTIANVEISYFRFVPNCPA